MKLHWFIKFFLVWLAALILWVTIFLVLPKLLPPKVISNSQVSGFILRNQVWEGTIRVTGDIVTAHSTKITIKPGTRVLVSIKGDRNNFDFLPWHRKSGINTGEADHGVRRGEPFWDEKEKIQIHISNLVALGTKEQPVVITSDSSSGSPYDFNMLDIKQGVISYVHLSNYRRLEVGDDVTVRNSVLKNAGECAVCIMSGRPSIIENTFDSSLREYIWVYQASPRITDNLFLPSKGSGVKLQPSRWDTPVVSFNDFEMPKSVALDVLSGGEEEGGAVSLNNFSGGSLIRIPCDTRLKFIENTFSGQISFTSGGCGSFSFGPNYWGTGSRDTVLTDKIVNKEAGLKLLIPSIMKTPSEKVGRRS